jgi:hypothetical protein
MVQKDTTVLPFAHAAFLRHLDRFPSAFNGLGIVEQTVLELAGEGVTSSIELFRQTGDRLHELGMGDVEFGYWFRRMLKQPHSLLELQDGAALPDPSLNAPLPSNQHKVVITELGSRVVAGEQDWIAIEGIDEWYGGLHLQGGIDWRWNPIGDNCGCWGNEKNFYF